MFEDENDSDDFEAEMRGETMRGRGRRSVAFPQMSVGSQRTDSSTREPNAERIKDANELEEFDPNAFSTEMTTLTVPLIKVKLLALVTQAVPNHPELTELYPGSVTT